MSEGLPPGWRLVEFGTLIDGVDAGKNIRCEERPPLAHERGLVKISAVTWGTFDHLASKTVPAGTVLPDSQRIKRGDFLISRANTLELVGATVIVSDAPDNLYLSDKVLRIRTSPDHARWLNWFLKSELGRAEIEKRASGNQLSMRNLGQGALREIPVPLPSLAEQRRIVARIEAVFARTRQARADLLRVAPLAERYKQEKHRQLLDAREQGWRTKPLGEIAQLIQYGSSAKTNGDDDGVPVLRMSNIQDGELELTSLKFLPKDHNEFPGLLLERGDVLFNRTNSVDLVGKTAVYLGNPAPCSFASYLIRLRLRGADPHIVAAYINSPHGREWAASSISQQVGQANINGAKLKALEVPDVPQAEQARVSSELRVAAVTKARVTNEATRALALLDHLERSILARAFRGELVPQDAADAPAASMTADGEAEAAPRHRRGRRRRIA